MAKMTRLANEDHRPDSMLRANTLRVAIDVLLASLANALNQADRVIMPIAAIPMAAELGWTMMDKGVVISAFAYGYICVQLPSGWVSSRAPALGLLLVSVLVWSLSTLLTPSAARQSFGSLIACRVVMGLAEGFCLPAIFQLFATSVPIEQRSRAFAFMIGCGALGQLLGLLVCPLISPWRSMFHYFGGAGLLWAVACAGLLSQRRCMKGASIPVKQNDTPSELGAESDDTGSSGGNPEVGEAPAQEPPFFPLLFRLGTCRPLIAICAAHFGQNWTNYTLSSWLPTYLNEVLGVPTRGLSLTALPFLANALTGMAVGHLADALIARELCSVLAIRRIATAIGLFGPAVCHLLFAMTRSPAIAIAIVTLSFACGGTTSSGYMANHSDISSSYAGLTFGISNTVATLPGVIAGPLTAWLIERNAGSWTAVFVLAAGINVACAAVYLSMSKAHRVL
jgi:MFS family permease